MPVAADPDRRLAGTGGDHPNPELRGREAVLKKIFSGLLASVWFKNKVCSLPWLHHCLLATKLCVSFMHLNPVNYPNVKGNHNLKNESE